MCHIKQCTEKKGCEDVQEGQRKHLAQWHGAARDEENASIKGDEVGWCATGGVMVAVASHITAVVPTECARKWRARKNTKDLSRSCASSAKKEYTCLRLIAAILKDGQEGVRR